MGFSILHDGFTRNHDALYLGLARHDADKIEPGAGRKCRLRHQQCRAHADRHLDQHTGINKGVIQPFDLDIGNDAAIFDARIDLGETPLPGFSCRDDPYGVVCGRGRNPTLRFRPSVFAGEIDVLPAERRDMGQEIGR